MVSQYAENLGDPVEELDFPAPLGQAFARDAGCRVIGIREVDQFKKICGDKLNFTSVICFFV